MKEVIKNLITIIFSVIFLYTLYSTVFLSYKCDEWERILSLIFVGLLVFFAIIISVASTDVESKENYRLRSATIFMLLSLANYAFVTHPAVLEPYRFWLEILVAIFIARTLLSA